MIITKEGLIEQEEGEYQISKSAIMTTLVCYWLLIKRYTEEDFREAGLPWRYNIKQVNDLIAPRDFFNYVYICEVIRTRVHHWYDLAEGRIEDWIKAGKTKRDLKIYKMYQALAIQGWSRNPDKSKTGALGNTAKAMRLSRQTVKNLIVKYPDPPEPPFVQRFARMILDYHFEQENRFGDLWSWNATHLLPPEYNVAELPTVNFEDFKKHNEGKKELDFSVLDEMYAEFRKLKLVYYGGIYQMFVTKGSARVKDLRKPSQ